MGQARELMDAITRAVVDKNLDALDDLYAPDVVITTPDAGEIRGLAAVKEWHRSFIDAFPDMGFDMDQEIESGNVAIDQGTAYGTNTQPMKLPDGSELPPTGKQIRLRAADIAVVENGKVVRHDFYFDQLEMMAQLGLMEAPATQA